MGSFLIGLVKTRRKMKLKLSFPKFRLKLEDTEEKKELRGTEGRYTLKEKAAPLAQQENDAEFRDFPDFDFIQIAGNTWCNSQIENHKDYQRSLSLTESDDTFDDFDAVTADDKPIMINFFTEVMQKEKLKNKTECELSFSTNRRQMMKEENLRLEELLNKGEEARRRRKITSEKVILV